MTDKKTPSQEALEQVFKILKEKSAPSPLGPIVWDPKWDDKPGPRKEKKGSIDQVRLRAFTDELQKIASVGATAPMLKGLRPLPKPGGVPSFAPPPTTVSHTVPSARPAAPGLANTMPAPAPVSGVAPTMMAKAASELAEKVREIALKKKLEAPKEAPKEEVKAASLVEQMKSVGQTVGQNLVKHEDMHDVIGLGTLAAPIGDNIQARFRANLAGDKSEHGVEKRQFLSEPAHDVIEAGGLAHLAATPIAKMLGAKHP